MNAFERLASVIAERKTADPSTSYTAKLMHTGVDKMNKKIIEEAYETCMAAKENDKAHLTAEICDLFYHTLVLAGYKDITIADIASELERRAGTSGLLEKASRGEQ
ncbi:MAG: phosphoribosyl-ATP diphosphatase [Spirochaetota bacterium]